MADLLGFPVDYSSPFFTGFVAVDVVALLMVLLYLQVLWTLASVVVVLESTWCFSSLIRSARLVKGAGTIAVSLMLVFGCLSGVLGVCSWVLEMGMNEATRWKNWGLAVLLGVTTVFLIYLSSTLLRQRQHCTCIVRLHMVKSLLIAVIILTCSRMMEIADAVSVRLT